MTNYNTQGRKSKLRDRGLRFLDLSFEGSHAKRYSTTSNAFRITHKGKTEHPPSQYSFDKPQEYHEEIQGEIDNMFADGYNEQLGTPAYVHDVEKQVVHSGESPLFTSQLLSSNKQEQRHGQIEFHKSLLKPNKCKPPLKQNGKLFYRPNRMHQYLTATELKDATTAEVDIRLGKPTRATLLRARSSRCSSAPVSNGSVKVTEKPRPMSAQTTKRFNPIETPNGETVHSFLIGARYNRAHYLDSKSLFQYGIYMPRSNPGQSFYVEKLLPAERKTETLAPSSSPSGNSRGSSVYDSDDDAVDDLRCLPMRSQEPRPKTSAPRARLQHRNAWGNDNVAVGPKRGRAVNTFENSSYKETKSISVKNTSAKHVINKVSNDVKNIQEKCNINDSRIDSSKCNAADATVNKLPKPRKLPEKVQSTTSKVDLDQEKDKSISTLNTLFMDLKVPQPLKEKGFTIKVNSSRLQGAKYIRNLYDIPTTPTSVDSPPIRKHVPIDIKGVGVTPRTPKQDVISQRGMIPMTSRPSSPSVDENRMELSKEIVDFYKESTSGTASLPVKKVRILDPTEESVSIFSEENKEASVTDAHDEQSAILFDERTLAMPTRPNTAATLHDESVTSIREAPFETIEEAYTAYKEPFHEKISDENTNNMDFHKVHSTFDHNKNNNKTNSNAIIDQNDIIEEENSEFQETIGTTPSDIPGKSGTTQADSGDNALFFITEDEDKKPAVHEHGGGDVNKDASTINDPDRHPNDEIGHITKTEDTTHFEENDGTATEDGYNELDMNMYDDYTKGIQVENIFHTNNKDVDGMSEPVTSVSVTSRPTSAKTLDSDK